MNIRIYMSMYMLLLACRWPLLVTWDLYQGKPIFTVLPWRIPGTGASWAAVYGVAQSRTRMKRLSSSSSLKSNLNRGIGCVCVCVCKTHICKMAFLIPWISGPRKTRKTLDHFFKFQVFFRSYWPFNIKVFNQLGYQENQGIGILFGWERKTNPKINLCPVRKGEALEGKWQQEEIQ